MPYSPPIGVPAPPFGIDETVPAVTLYVNAVTGSDSNPGTIGSPKATIPRPLAAGTVCQVSGDQTFDYATSNRIVMNGTALSPVFIVSDPANPMRFTKWNEITGTFGIVDGGEGVGWQVTDQVGGGVAGAICIRNGTHTQNGIAIATFEGGDVSYVVVYNMSIHSLGNMTAGEAGGDHHGVKVVACHHVWVLNSVFYLCAGDGVQVGDATVAASATHHVYLGLNIGFLNRQSCHWAKESIYVVMSSNIAFAIRPIEEPPTGSGVYLNPGVGFGAQNAADELVILSNIVTSCENGIFLASYNSATVGDIRIVGNHVYNVHGTVTTGTVDNARSPGAAITCVGGRDRFVGNNTIVDVDCGLQNTPNASGTVTALNNIFACGAGARADVVWETLEPDLGYNLFDNAAVYHPTTDNPNGVTADPLFVNPPSDVRLRNGSPALAAGFGYDIDTAYTAIHGVSIGLTLTGTPNIGASLGAGVLVRYTKGRRLIRRARRSG